MPTRGKVLSFPRRSRRTNGGRVAAWLNAVVRPNQSGAGVLTINEAGELFEGRMLQDAFIWVPASAAARIAYSVALNELYRQAA